MRIDKECANKRVGEKYQMHIEINHIIERYFRFNQYSSPPIFAKSPIPVWYFCKTFSIWVTVVPVSNFINGAWYPKQHISTNALSILVFHGFEFLLRNRIHIGLPNWWNRNMSSCTGQMSTISFPKCQMLKICLRSMICWFQGMVKCTIT